jgi:predicted proteasome-type protease
MAQALPWMTVCVAVLVNDCIVFAADSATTVSQTNAAGQDVVINVYEHANKVFNLYKGIPVCAMTCGMGNIGVQSIAELAKELRLRLRVGEQAWKIEKETYSLSDIAEKARKFFFEEKYNAWAGKPTGPHSFSLHIGGYSAKSDTHELWNLQIENGNCAAPSLVRPKGECGINWAGQPECITRLVFGFSSKLEESLVKAGLNAADVKTLINTHLKNDLQVHFVWDAMPVQDAIHLARFFVETTKQYCRFLPGANIVGGDTDIAVVTKYEGFKWVARKHYYPAHLNLLETDHAQ